MHTRKTLRSPFVVTFAAGAATLAAGCGSTITPPSADASVVSDREPEPDVVITNPPPPPGVCPATPPTVGEPCRPLLGPTGTCRYGLIRMCGAYPQYNEFACSDGRWITAIATCNPPPPDAGPSPCPTDPPAAGAYCTGSATCSYDSCQNPRSIGYARCTGSAWELGYASCNPPPPPVDAGPPLIDASNPPPPVDAGAPPPSLLDAGVEAVCPRTIPEQGSRCLGPALCCYDGPGSEWGGASCLGGAWNRFVGTCNPPALDAGPPQPCPSSPPPDQGACQGRTSCYYDACLTNGVGGAHCNGYVWTLYRGICNSPVDAG